MRIVLEGEAMGGQELRVGAAAVVEEHLPNLGVWCHVITARGEGGGRYDSSRGHDRSPSFWGVVKARAGARLRLRLIVSGAGLRSGLGGWT